MEEVKKRGRLAVNSAAKSSDDFEVQFVGLAIDDRHESAQPNGYAKYSGCHLLRSLIIEDVCVPAVSFSALCHDPHPSLFFHPSQIEQLIYIKNSLT